MRKMITEKVSITEKVITENVSATNGTSRSPNTLPFRPLPIVFSPVRGALSTMRWAWLVVWEVPFVSATVYVRH